jgi:hypothetical protein
MYWPSYNPDASISTEDLYCPYTSAIVPEEDMMINETPDEAPISGYSNKSSKLLMYWQTTGSTQKTNKEVNRLICEVIYHPNFKIKDFNNFNATCENQNADSADKKSSFLWSFRHTSIMIDVPSGSTYKASQLFSIPGLYYCQITTLIKQAFESPISSKFHFTPFKLF